MAVKRTSIEVFVEIPGGSRNKYEYDKERGLFKLDRVLFSSVHYPADYGFVPHTLSLDGDPLDALVVIDHPTFPGCVIDVRPIGVLDMRDEQGHDEKLLTVPTHDPRYRHITKMEHIGPHWLREIENFFATYKALEDKWTELVGWYDEKRAWEIIEESEKRYAEVEVGKKHKPEIISSISSINHIAPIVEDVSNAANGTEKVTSE